MIMSYLIILMFSCFGWGTVADQEIGEFNAGDPVVQYDDSMNKDDGNQNGQGGGR